MAALRRGVYLLRPHGTTFNRHAVISQPRGSFTVIVAEQYRQFRSKQAGPEIPAAFNFDVYR